MTTIRIDILNPKAEKLLKNLEELELIAIRDSKEDLFQLIGKLRSKELLKPTLEEITEEVEEVRRKRYSGK